MRFTKKQLLTAFYLLLDDHLPSIICAKIEKEGNWQCNRCDSCMIEQYLKKAKAGQVPKIVSREGGDGKHV